MKIVVKYLNYFLKMSLINFTTKIKLKATCGSYECPDKFVLNVKNVLATNLNDSVCCLPTCQTF